MSDVEDYVTMVTCVASEDNYHLVISINGEAESVDIRDTPSVDRKIMELESLSEPTQGVEYAIDMLMANRKD